MEQLTQPPVSGPAHDVRPGDHDGPRAISTPPPRPVRSGSARLVDTMLRMAGLRVGGDRPWDLRVCDSRFYPSVLSRGSLGFGESYMRGWWEVDDLEEVAYRLSRAGLHRVARALPIHLAALAGAALVNRQTRSDSAALADRHYNLGNDLFAAFLGPSMVYSGAVFDGTQALDEAQAIKLDLICRRLELAPGDRLLDVGGGWGELARYAAARYGCHVTSINIADEQIRHARELCAGLPVDVVKCDYRDLRGTYDKVAVIAMLTHVGPRNYRSFMEAIHRTLVDGGRMLLETLGSRISKVNCEPWTNTYIFPGGVVPSIRQIDRACQGLLRRTEVAAFSDHYIPTLRAWNANLDHAWPTLAGRYPETTRRMLRYFFLTIAGAFRAGHLKYWHIDLEKAPRAGLTMP